MEAQLILSPPQRRVSANHFFKMVITGRFFIMDQKRFTPPAPTGYLGAVRLSARMVLLRERISQHGRIPPASIMFSRMEGNSIIGLDRSQVVQLIGLQRNRSSRP